MKAYECIDKELKSDISTLLKKSISDYYVSKIMTEDFVSDVIEDVKTCSAWEDEKYYNEDDIKLAIGRVFMKRIDKQSY